MAGGGRAGGGGLRCLKQDLQDSWGFSGWLATGGGLMERNSLWGRTAEAFCAVWSRRAGEQYDGGGTGFEGGRCGGDSPAQGRAEGPTVQLQWSVISGQRWRGLFTTGRE